MGTRLLRSIAALVLAGQPLGGLVPTTSGPDPVVLVDTPAEIVEMAEWALDLFEQADLELPAIELRYHGDDPSGCDDHEAIHRPGPDGSVIELCTSVVGFSTRVTILHELAHAWSQHTADASALATFQELRGYDHWLDYDAALWHDNGTEQAAEILVWGLVDRPMAMSRITQNSCDELHAGYVTLTGAEPLHGFRDLCRA